MTEDCVRTKLLLATLLVERHAKYHKGIYHYTQTALAYNSNRIEGSRLSLEHTINLFSTHTLLTETNEVINGNDIIETVNHFRAFDYILTNCQDPLDTNP